MPFKGNAITSAVVQTAVSGRRVVIGITDALAATIQWFTGRPTEFSPALMAAVELLTPTRLVSYWASATHTSRPGVGSTIRQTVTPTRASVEIETERLSLFNPDLVTAARFLIDGFDILGAWQPFTFAISSGGTQPTPGASTFQGYYLRMGKTVIYRFRFVSGAGWAPGTGDYYISLPVAARMGAPSSQLDCGAGFIYNAAAAGVYAGTWYVQSPNALTFMIANSPGAPYMGGGQMAAGSNFGGTIIYEAA